VGDMTKGPRVPATFDLRPYRQAEGGAAGAS
jgi:hypothetical protein